MTFEDRRPVQLVDREQDAVLRPLLPVRLPVVYCNGKALLLHLDAFGVGEAPTEHLAPPPP
jgi:hypothetical protein